MYEFKLPDLGEGIHEAEILKWHVGPGDRIDEDAPLVDVETDKAAVTIPSPKKGTVVSTHGLLGDVVTVGQTIVVLDNSDHIESSPRKSPQLPPKPAASLSAVRPSDHKVPAAPATRRLARELGVTLAHVVPTGPAGRVTSDDVRNHAEHSQRTAGAPSLATPSKSAASSETTKAHDPHLQEALKRFGIPFYGLESMPDFEQFGPVEREPIRSIRRKIARKMVTSLIVVPHVIHMDEADVTALENFRIRSRETHPDRPKFNLLSFVVKAVVAGLRRWPMFNASLDPDREEIVYKKYYNIGLAADTPRGLIVPVVHEADRKSVLELTTEIRELAQAARSGEIAIEALQGGSFTVTNIGPLGGIALAPAINYPEVAILGMGKVQEKPVVRDGKIVVRKMLPLTLSFDHRVADGADAARFISFIVHLLSDPENILLEV